MAGPAIALVVQPDTSIRREIATCLRDLGFSVSEFDDECRFYAQAIRLMSNPGCDRESMVILAEPTECAMRDLKTLRSCSLHTGIVLVDGPEHVTGEGKLRAARLRGDRPSRDDVERAVEAAFAASRAATQ
ncbi:MAG TPA: hypothetical protein VMS22_26440 [Candidatus Eisenbacteria bacterium]|nr:hypothetical protein [Candidatus Eisenbacteria bacterium]